MTKEEIKANALIEIFTEHEDSEIEYRYACERALKCVDEIIKTIEFMSESDEPNKLPFWQSVKQILEAK